MSLSADLRFTILALCALAFTSCAAMPKPSPFAVALKSEPGTVLQVRPIVSVLSSATSDAVDGQVYVAVIGPAPGAREQPLGLSYTVRRARDGVAVEIAQPPGEPLAIGAAVRIVYDDRVRLVPN